MQILPPKQHRLSSGLPTCLARDVEGFETLKRILGLNRERCKWVLETKIAKKWLGASRHEAANRKLSSRDRSRRLLFQLYGNPEFRRACWAHWYEYYRLDQEPTSFTIPSLEKAILDTLQVQQEGSLDDGFAEWPDLSQYLEENDVPWSNFAARSWSVIRSRISSWESIESEQRNGLTLGIFAIATITDDERILRRAVEDVPDLADDLGTLFDHPHRRDNIADDGVLNRWSELCDELRKLSELAAGPPPVVDRLAEIRDVVESLETIEESTRSHSTAALFAHLTSIVDGHLAEFERETEMGWLGEAERSVVRSEWEKVGASLSSAEIRQEIDRLSEDVPAVVNRIRGIERELASLSVRRNIMSQEMATNLVSRNRREEELDEIEEEAIILRRARRGAHAACLRQLAPLGGDSAAELEEQFRNATAEVAKTDEEVTREDDDPADGGMQPDGSGPGSEEGGGGSGRTDSPNVDKEPQPLDQDPEHEGAEVRDASGIAKTAGPCVKDPPDPGRASVSAADGDVSDDDVGAAVEVDQPHTKASAERLSGSLLERPPRFAFALQLARLVDRAMIGGAALPAPFLEAALLSDHLSVPDGVLSGKLTRAIAMFPAPESFVEQRDVSVMLALSGILRASLLSPQTGAWTVLAALKPSDRLRSVYEYCSGVAGSTRKLQGVRVDSVVLKSVASRASWDHEYGKLCEEIEDWLPRAAQMTIKYAPATAVWQRWVNRGGLIHRMTSAVLSKGEDYKLIENTADSLANRRTFNRIVKRTDRVELARRRGQDIQAGALDQLEEHARQAVRLARRYLSLSLSRSSEGNFLIQEISTLRDVVERLQMAAVEVLESIRNDSDVLVSASANCAAYAIHRFAHLLAGETKDEPPYEGLVASGLYGFPSVRIGLDGFPAGEPSDTIDKLLNTEVEEPGIALDKRLGAGDFEGVLTIASWIKDNDDGDVERIEARLHDRLTMEKRRLRRDVDGTRTIVEVAIARGHVSESERAKYDAELAGIEKRVMGANVPAFERERARLTQIADSVADALERRRSQANGLLAGLSIPRKTDDYRNIAASIERGDIMTANEHIDRIRGKDVGFKERVEIRESGIFERFFPGSCSALERAIEESGTFREAVSCVASGRAFGGLSFDEMADDQRKSAESLVNAWFRLKLAGSFGGSAQDDMATLFSSLGFVVKSVAVLRSDRAVGEARLVTGGVTSRELCPIPAYGSFANGKYRLVCLWGSPTEEDILQHAEGRTRMDATIVLYFGSLPSSRRMGLARRCRERSRTAIVIDDLLLLFLCAEHDARMATFFACSIPFTYVQPYITTAGLVPPEMFYGREQEMREVSDPHGSCFIYGGRQLGKTALLRAVERRSHHTESGNYAAWIDLKAVGIGHDRRVADIWSAIWRTLGKLCDIPEQVKEPNPNAKGRVEAFESFLSSHFNSRTGRSLLLLLDEADRFLEVDARAVEGTSGFHEYRESTRLKALMDNTERSIKIVFAGLHNVLRTAESSNHPLAHFGHPIQIAPLWTTAETLVRRPLLSAGYRFANDNVVTRILAQTNYYPNLIQLYGSELVKTMSARNLTGSPLYEIDEDVIDDVYLKNTNLGEMIRLRFNMTVQLDQRYEVIAYAIAYECDIQDDVLSEGLNHRTIDEKARDWWPAGFDDIEPYTDRFRVLLDEMTGLGILRKTASERYTLRNPNVLSLLGSSSDIADNLLAEREAPQDFDLELFRAHDPEYVDSPVRSPLTYQQENNLRTRRNGVSVVCGLRAAGYDDVLRFITRRRSEEAVVELTKPTSVTEFERELRSVQARRGEGTTIYVIPDTVPWSEAWVQTAMDSVRALRRRDKNVRVVFMADPQHLMQLMAPLEELSRAGPLEWVPLRPWREGFLRQWLDDVGFRGDATSRGAIVELTGGWPTLLTRLHEVVRVTGSVEAGMERLAEELKSDRSTGKWAALFGVEAGSLQSGILRDLTQLGQADIDDLETVSESDAVDRGTLSRFFRWAELLHLIKRRGQGTWQVDSVVALLLASNASI